ncbi:iron ABC transporter permease [Prochlorococcus sp. MIT 1223]|uniref:ABC transporter permease n=1 Tax=Prochlorococcus sp. MIT 1223 TaxID=3096217 RepID=UPI002A757686|nr:iron ABC transporter permease [Prochlorococcus sp. MIT 1223]
MKSNNLKARRSNKYFLRRSFIQDRSILYILTIIVALIALFPLVNLISEGVNGIKNGSVNLGIDGADQIKGTFILFVFSSTLGAIIGTVNGWLHSNCRFTGRKLLRIAQLIPLATPAYLLSATLIDLGSINSIRIYGLPWGVLIMAFTTYPYVYLLSTESFSISGKRQLEACRSMGIGPWKSFFRIALPMAIPAIGAGIALMGMEIINELGAVQLLNIPTISAGIVENWMSENNPSGAIGLALIALLIVIGLITFERILRRRSRRWNEGIAGGEAPEWELKGIRAILSQFIGIIAPTFTLGIPIFWCLINSDQLIKSLDVDLFSITIRSILLGLVTSLITLSSAILLAISKRWAKSRFINLITFLSGIGYAIPGVVMAMALLSFSNSALRFPPFLLLIWGYSVRFLAVAKGGIDSSFERMHPNLDEAAVNLGSRWPRVLKKIHLPLLKGPMLVGSLLVFVDTLKELPLTFVLRPFDFDTLSVRIFQYAGDERMAEAIIPAMLILIIGLIASLALIPSLGEIHSNKSKNLSN